MKLSVFDFIDSPRNPGLKMPVRLIYTLSILVTFLE